MRQNHTRPKIAYHSEWTAFLELELGGRDTKHYRAVAAGNIQMGREISSEKGTSLMPAYGPGFPPPMTEILRQKPVGLKGGELKEAISGKNLALGLGGPDGLFESGGGKTSRLGGVYVFLRRYWYHFVDLAELIGTAKYHWKGVPGPPFLARQQVCPPEEQ